MTQDTATAPTWYEATRVASPVRERLAHDLDVDVCVIGAGLAGLTVAREVARRGWSVVVLEGASVASAASGRNTGFVLPGYSESIDAMIERIGLDHARELWALAGRGLDYVRKTIADTGMPGVEPVPGWLQVSKTDNGGELSARADLLRKLGVDVDLWPVSRVRETLPSRDYFNALHFPSAFHIHPLNYAFGLARAAEDAGARIFEDTPALALDPAGVRKRITTPSARLRASHVVLAGNIHLGSLMPQLASTLMPLSSYVMVTEPLGARLHETLRFYGAVSDTERADNHYRIVGGDRLMWAGRLTAWQANPRLFARGLIGDIKRTFPQLGDVAIAHLWSGTLGRSIHRMPQIGELNRGVWVASGFGGHGLNTTAMAGELVARGIVDGDQTWRLFAPYELVWAGGLLGRAAMQAFYWGSRPVAKIATGLARYREYARAEKKVKLAKRDAERELAQMAAQREAKEKEYELTYAAQNIAPGGAQEGTQDRAHAQVRQETQQDAQVIERAPVLPDGVNYSATPEAASIPGHDTVKAKIRQAKLMGKIRNRKKNPPSTTGQGGQGSRER